jgi:hypothetical protein
MYAPIPAPASDTMNSVSGSKVLRHRPGPFAPRGSTVSGRQTACQVLLPCVYV